MMINNIDGIVLICSASLKNEDKSLLNQLENREFSGLISLTPLMAEAFRSEFFSNMY